MATNHAPVDPDPEDIERAQEGWHFFTKASIYFTGAVVVIVALLGIFLL